jgi:potassium efflux system protein
VNDLVLQGLGWLGFLHRPLVLRQLLCAGLAFLLLALLRRRFRAIGALSRLVSLTIGTALAMLLAVALRFNYGLLLLVAELLAGFWGLRVVERRMLQPLLPPQVFAALVSRFLRPAFFLGVFLVLLDAVASLNDLASLPLGTWLGGEIDLGALFFVVVVMYTLIATSALPANGVGWLAGKGLRLTPGSQRALATLLRYGIILLGVVWALDRMGIDKRGVLAVAGGLSVGLGFGVKEVFSNFISGLWLLVEGSVRPGEVLIHDGDACEVRALDPRATTLLRSRDNAELMVPNQTFFTTTTTTYTRSDRTRRCEIEVSAPSSWTPDRMIAQLERLAASHPQVLAHPKPRCLLLSFSPTSHSYRLSFSITDPLRADAITAEVRLEIWRRFDEEGLLATPPGTDQGSRPSAT